MAILEEFKPEIIVFDESQLIKNPTAKRTKACVALSKLARFRFLLTGTPIAKGSITTQDTLIFNAQLNTDGTVAFAIDPNSGCKTHKGGAIC